MVNTTIKLELKNLDANNNEVSKTVNVMLQEVSPFKSMPIISANTLYNVGGKTSYDWASIVQQMATNEIGVIVSPKNIVKQIEEATNATTAIVLLGIEIFKFCDSPRLYVLKKQEEVQRESQDAADVVGADNTQPVDNGGTQA